MRMQSILILGDPGTVTVALMKSVIQAVAMAAAGDVAVILICRDPDAAMS